jgi:hypothetical protein
MSEPEGSDGASTPEPTPSDAELRTQIAKLQAQLEKEKATKDVQAKQLETLQKAQREQLKKKFTESEWKEWGELSLTELERLATAKASLGTSTPFPPQSSSSPFGSNPLDSQFIPYYDPISGMVVQGSKREPKKKDD